MKEHIIINKDRTVVVPDSVRKIGIQYDHKVNTLTFDCPRYADDNQSIDMSRMAIYINFSRNDKTKGSIAATNIFVDPDNPEIMHFDVVITRSVTLVNGPIICLVCAKSTDAEGVEVNHWNSELFNKLSVGEGLEAEELTEEEIDYITSLLQEINTTRAEVADMDTRVEDLEFNQEKQGAVSEVDLEAMTWTEGSYITGSGAIGSSSGYGISEPVTLPKMSTLILDATGYQSDVAMIAKSDHTPLVTSVDGKTHYEYYTDEEIQVYISCKTTVAKSAKIVRNVSETLSDLERENSELKGELDGKINTPKNSDGTISNGISGQILQANGDGTTQWVDKPPTVPDWAKQPEKPSYTASEVGADATGTAESKVSDHDVSDTAHNDIRLLIEGLTTRLNALADSDDTTLDQMGEVVAYIKSNRSMISSITTDKVNVTSIVNDLTTNVANKPLSAAQGVALKALIDEMNVPASTTADNGKVLSVVDGVPSWTITSSEQAAISAANAERSATIAQECAQAMAGTFDFTGYLRYQVLDAAPETYEEGVLYIVTNS